MGFTRIFSGGKWVNQFSKRVSHKILLQTYVYAIYDYFTDRPRLFRIEHTFFKCV
jgi:hypothetical protein